MQTVYASELNLKSVTIEDDGFYIILSLVNIKFNSSELCTIGNYIAAYLFLLF